MLAAAELAARLLDTDALVVVIAADAAAAGLQGAHMNLNSFSNYFESALLKNMIDLYKAEAKVQTHLTYTIIQKV